MPNGYRHLTTAPEQQIMDTEWRSEAAHSVGGGVCLAVCVGLAVWGYKMTGDDRAMVVDSFSENCKASTLGVTNEDFEGIKNFLGSDACSNLVEKMRESMSEAVNASMSSGDNKSSQVSCKEIPPSFWEGCFSDVELDDKIKNRFLVVTSSEDKALIKARDNRKNPKSIVVLYNNGAEYSFYCDENDCFVKLSEIDNHEVKNSAARLVENIGDKSEGGREEVGLSSKEFKCKNHYLI